MERRGFLKGLLGGAAAVGAAVVGKDVLKTAEAVGEESPSIISVPKDAEFSREAQEALKTGRITASGSSHCDPLYEYDRHDVDWGGNAVLNTTGTTTASNDVNVHINTTSNFDVYELSNLLYRAI